VTTKAGHEANVGDDGDGNADADAAAAMSATTATAAVTMQRNETEEKNCGGKERERIITAAFDGAADSR